jgi:RNA polymerase sigma-70 factor, ECF subfamily
MNTLKRSAQIDEQMLVRRAGNGDLEAFNQLVMAYQDMAYNHARAMLGDPASAEDAAQESFVKAFENMPGFRGGSFRAWLLKIVTNSAYDVLRHSHRHPTQPLFPEDEYGHEIEAPAWLADPNTSIQVTVEEKEEAQRLYQLLDELPEVYRSVITLVDLYEMDYVEAAEILKVPVGTIKSRLARARLRMQEKLQDGFHHIRENEAVSNTALARFHTLC